MKKIFRLLSVGIIFIFLFSACTVEKRRYSSGYNIDWKHSKVVSPKNVSSENENSVEGDKSVSTKKTVANNILFDETVTASADNSTISPYAINKKVSHHAVVSSEDCDVIFLKTGEEIKAKVYEISPEGIKYKKCGDINGPTYTLRKSEVFMIKYPNGTKDIITEPIPAAARPIEKEDSGVFGILSFSSLMLAVILGIMGLGVFTLLLILAAIAFGAIGIGRKRKLKGLAIAGLTLGLAYVFLVLILIIALSNSFR